jgi:hypothetical protein
VTTQRLVRSKLRVALQTAGLAAVTAFGFAVAVQPQRAAADGLPLPTVSTPTLPTLPVTLPTLPLPGGVTTPTTTATTPTTTATATTTAAPTTTSAATATAPVGTGSPPAGVAADPVRDPAAEPTAGVTGAIRLTSGGWSIPVSSVLAPARITVGVAAVAPGTIRSRNQLIKVTVRIGDTRGYLVRGATVAIRGNAAAWAGPIAAKRTAADGRAVFRMRTARRLAVRPGRRLALLISSGGVRRTIAIAMRR